MIDRRTLLQAGTAIGLGAAAPAFAQPSGLAAQPSGLAALAARGGRRFGSCLAYGPPGAASGSFANPDYARLLMADCQLLVAENEMKWQALRPDATRFDFRRGDAILAWAEAQAMPMRGHTLFWYDPVRFPRWLSTHDLGQTPASAAVALVEQHVDRVARHYGGRIMSWDVVNEAIQPETGVLRRNVLADAVGGGPALIDAAFHAARAALPDAELVYNDFMSWEGGGNAAHRRGVLELLEGFRARGVPVDALGVQSHIGLFDGRPVAEQVRAFTPEWRKFLDAVVAMGYRLLITELDVNDKALMPDRARRADAVGAYAGAYLDMMLDYPQLRDILVWGMTDRFSWLQGFSPRADGLEKIACPYDRDFRVHPMHTAIARAFAAAPRLPA